MRQKDTEVANIYQADTHLTSCGMVHNMVMHIRFNAANDQSDKGKRVSVTLSRVSTFIRGSMSTWAGEIQAYKLHL